MARLQRQSQGGGALPGLAAIVVVLMLCVVSASAWLRLAQPRVPCTGWPACRGHTALAAAHAAPAPAAAPDAQFGAPRTTDIVRSVHRVAATTVLLLVIALVALLLRRRPRRRELLRPAFALLGLAVGLSVLGVFTPGSRASAVLLGNLLGGFLMLGVAVALLVRLVSARALSDKVARRAGWALALWLAQAALGALSGASVLDLAPPLHLALAVATLPVAALAGWSARAEPEPAARALGIILLLIVPLQFFLGAGATFQAAAVRWVLPHNATAALGFAVLCGLLALRGTASPMPRK